MVVASAPGASGVPPTRIRRHVVVWWAALIATALCGLFWLLYSAKERTIHAIAPATHAISEARVELSQAFLELALHENDTDGTSHRRALALIGAGQAAIASAITLAQPSAVPDDVRQRLSSFQRRLATLANGRLAELSSDQELAPEFEQLNIEIGELDQRAEDLLLIATLQLDDLFARTSAGMLVLLVGFLAIVIVTNAARARSVEAHRLAEAASRHQAKLLNAIAEGTTDAVFVKDRDGRYLYANHAAGTFVGKDKADLIGRDDGELFDATSAELVRAHDRMVMSTRLAETTEEIITAADTTRTFLATKAPYFDDQGDVIGVIGVSRDISARKQHEEALRESESRLELALASAQMGVWSVDLRTGKIFWSREIFLLTGYTSTPASFEEFLGLVVEEDRPSVEAAIATAIATRSRYTPTYRLRVADGSVRWVANNGAVVLDAAGEPVTMRGVTFDVTERMQTQEALRISEERYRHFLEALPDAVFLQERDRVVYCNPAYLAMRGTTNPTDVLGRPALEMFPEDCHDLMSQRLAQLRETGQSPAPIEKRIKRFDGRTVPVFVAATQLIDKERAAVLVVLRDLTREYQAEAWAQSILDHTIDGIISTDYKGTITSFNRAAEDAFGYDALEVLGQHISVLVPSSTPDDIGERREKVAVRKNGTQFPVDVAVSSFDYDEERHVIAVARDISDRRKLEAELRQAQKMESIGRLAGGVAHDFNNLLTVILGYSEMLEDALPDGDRRRQFAADIRRATGRAADLTRQLLTFSRRAVVAPKVIDVNTVIKDIQRMLRRVLGEDIELVVVPNNVPKPVYIDPGALEQMVMNLCVNARDAMPLGGRLTVAAAQTSRGDGVDAAGSVIAFGDYVTIAVSDTGEGIPPDVLPHIFEPFFTTKSVGKGTGLGLAVVQGIAAQNGGYILVDTVPNQGTTFLVRLPVAEAAISPSKEALVHPPRGGGETILVVEDEDPVRRLAVLALQSAGYRVLEAPDGRAALQVFDEHRAHVDLVVTAVAMPQLSGRELALALHAREPGLPVIYTSGYADDAVLRRGISRADVQFLPKPYTPISLMQKVRDVIDLTKGRPSSQSPA
jgi:PAS domain S-box-containing protein